MPLARASTRFAPIHVGDVAEAFMRALHGGDTSAQTYELCGAETLSLAELVQQVARARQLRCHVLAMPDALGWLQAAVLEFLPESRCPSITSVHCSPTTYAARMAARAWGCAHSG